MDFLIEPKQLLEETRRGEVVIVDTRRPADYAKGHIPGAINFSTYDIFAMDTRADGLAAFAKDMAVRYADAGASAQRTVVLYEEQTGMRAARDACRDRAAAAPAEHPHVVAAAEQFRHHRRAGLAGATGHQYRRHRSLPSGGCGTRQRHQVSYGVTGTVR